MRNEGRGLPECGMTGCGFGEANQISKVSALGETAVVCRGRREISAHEKSQEANYARKVVGEESLMSKQSYVFSS